MVEPTDELPPRGAPPEQARRSVASAVASAVAYARSTWAAWAAWARAQSAVAGRRRLVLGALITAGVAVLAAVGLLIALRAQRFSSASPSASSIGLGPITPCAGRPTADVVADAGASTRVSTWLGKAPLAETLRDAGVEPNEVYRVRRALESIPGFVGIDQGRFVATRAASGGAVEAFEVRTPTWLYRGRSDPAGQLVAERTTEAPEPHLCSGAIPVRGSLEESVAASTFDADVAALLALALAGRVEVASLPPGSEIFVIAREVQALGGFAGYDGFAAIEVRSAPGAPVRLYGLRGANEVIYLDAEGHAKPAPAVQPTDAMRATFQSSKAPLDVALDTVAPRAPIAAVSAPAPSGSAPAGDAARDDGASDEESQPDTSLDAPEDREPPIREDPTRTVAQAAKASCSTRIVAGLSRQIIAEARCLDADAFARIPARKNLRASSNVFLYLEEPARDHLLRVLDKNPTRTLTVNSALRTVAQQVLLSKWGETKRCGVRLAALPSESNHESGLALDVQEASAWRKSLEAEGFKWMGRKDPVHFDYAGPGAVDHRGLDVRAFQRLWNRNNPSDAVGETGKLDPKTKQRLLKSPASGFPLGARCSG